MAPRECKPDGYNPGRFRTKAKGIESWKPHIHRVDLTRYLDTTSGHVTLSRERICIEWVLLSTLYILGRNPKSHIYERNRNPQGRI